MFSIARSRCGAPARNRIADGLGETAFEGYVCVPDGRRLREIYHCVVQYFLPSCSIPAEHGLPMWMYAMHSSRTYL
jgi:hypothetical protein